MASKRNPDDQRSSDSRTAILEAAKYLFAESGFRGASLASVAERAGLSQPGLLHHFPSKPALLLALLSEQDASGDAIWKPESDDELLDGLRRLAGYNQEHPSDSRFMSVLLGESISPRHPAHQYFVDRYKRARGDITRKLEAKAVGDETAREIAAIIVATLDGLQYQWLLDPDVDRAKNFDRFAQILHVYLQANPSADA